MSHEQHNHSLADFPHSYWRSYPIPHHPPMQSDQTTEVANRWDYDGVFTDESWKTRDTCRSRHGSHRCDRPYNR